jgi:hypothetical protein
MGAGERMANAVDFIEESQLSTEEVAVNCVSDRRYLSESSMALLTARAQEVVTPELMTA